MYANHARNDFATSLSLDDEETAFTHHTKTPFFSRDLKKAKTSSYAVKKFAIISDELNQALLAYPLSNVPSTLVEEIWSAFEARTRERLDDKHWNFIKFGSGNLPEDVGRFHNIHLVAKTALKDRVRSTRFGKREWLHANEINFANGRKFIASQCPKKLEQLGFLRMLGQYQVPLIVDLVSDTDYASHLQGAYYGPSEIENKRTDLDSVPTISRISDYPTIHLLGHQVKTKLFIEHLRIVDGRTRSHSVCRLHFPSWPDHGVISSATLRALANAVEEHYSQDTRPMLVHCRAGVGRTGTLISYIAARDIIKDSIRAGNPCNRATIVQTALQVIAKGRLDRGPNFVQRGIQFKLIVDTLIEEAGELLGWGKVLEKNHQNEHDRILKGQLKFNSQVRVKPFDDKGNWGTTVELPPVAIGPYDDGKSSDLLSVSRG